MIPEVQPEAGNCLQAFRPVSWPCLQHQNPPASMKPLFTAGGISLWHWLFISTAMILFSYIDIPEPCKTPVHNKQQ